jgi:hypothetical protein
MPLVDERGGQLAREQFRLLKGQLNHCVSDRRWETRRGASWPSSSAPAPPPYSARTRREKVERRIPSWARVLVLTGNSRSFGRKGFRRRFHLLALGCFVRAGLRAGAPLGLLACEGTLRNASGYQLFGQPYDAVNC